MGSFRIRKYNIAKEMKGEIINIKGSITNGYWKKDVSKFKVRSSKYVAAIPGLGPSPSENAKGLMSYWRNAGRIQYTAKKKQRP